MICELGKFTKDATFKEKTTDYFWRIICDGDSYKEELVNNCITKFCDMVKSWDMKVKHEFFLGLIKNLAVNRSSIATLKLFKNLIKDQKDKFTYTTTYYNTSPAKVEEVKTEEAPLTLAVSLQKLITENELVKVLMDNIKFYCDEVTKKIASNEYDLT